MPARIYLGSLGGSLLGVDIALGELVDRTGDGVMLIDREDVVRYWNQGAEAMFQYAREEVLGRKIGFLLPRDLTESGELDWIQRKIDAEGCLCNFLTRRVRKDGVERWVSLTRSVLHDTNGNVIGSTAVFRDVTEERRMQEQLSTARGLAVVGEMSVTLAHRIKNGLAGIYGAIQLLARGIPAGDPRVEVYAEIRREVERLDETARDLLRYASPGPLRRETTDLKAFLESTIDLLERLPEVRKHEIEVRGPDGIRVAIDRGAIGQTIHCLVLNAAEAMESPGRILVAARALDGTAEIDVVDGGPGIPATMHASIFQAFFTTKSQGTGLGLPIARKNVEAHGGMICAENSADGGARFTIRLPLGAVPCKVAEVR
jgi:PAS domain S-box-containing protein